MWEMRHSDIAVTVIVLLIFRLIHASRQSRAHSAMVFEAAVCDRISGLTKSQREQCKKMPHIMPTISEGAALGLRECQHQFRNYRWNCSHVTNKRVFGHVMVIGSREAAFFYAISSAGVTYALTAACSRGNITACGCEPTARTKNVSPPNGWKWGGCSADVTYSMRIARKFLNAREIEDDSRSLMNIHNNKAGRRIVKSLLQTECKCHGVSGSCTVRTCWKTLPTFRHIGDTLMKKYYRAKQVAKSSSTSQKSPPSSIQASYDLNKSIELPSTINNCLKSEDRLSTESEVSQNCSKRLGELHGGHLVLIHPKTNGKSEIRLKIQPKQNELVYLEASPTYCEFNISHGSLGTQSRFCKRSSKGTDGCNLLCCGRGYNIRQYTRIWQCRCHFRWCCRVNCETCTNQTEEYTCK